MTQKLTVQREGHHALITGGGTGIGRGAAIALAAEGTTATVASRTGPTLKETVRLVRDAGGRTPACVSTVCSSTAALAQASATKHCESTRSNFQ